MCSVRVHTAIWLFAAGAQVREWSLNSYLFCVRLLGHTVVLDQQAKLVGINCVVQRSMEAGPPGSDIVNGAATEFRVKCQDTLLEKG